MRRALAAVCALAVVLTGPAVAAAAAVAGPRVAPRVALLIDVEHPSPVAGTDWTLFVVATNDGTVALAPQGLLTITPLSSSTTLEQRQLLYPAIAPGKSFDGSVHLGPVPAGSYELAVKLGPAGGFINHTELAFHTRPPQSLGSRILSDLPYVLAAIAGLVAFVLARRVMPPPRREPRPERSREGGGE